MRARRAQESSMFGAITGVWWMFLITGIAWLIIALIVLRFDTTSIATVGALLFIPMLVWTVVFPFGGHHFRLLPRF